MTGPANSTLPTGPALAHPPLLPLPTATPGQQPLASLAGCLLALMVLVSQLIRLTIRDQPGWLAIWFYATPPALLLLVSLLTAGLLRQILWGRYRTFLSRTCRWLLLLAIAASTIRVVATEFAWRSPASQPTDSPFRLLYWNIGHGAWGWDAIFDELAHSNADLIALVETGSWANSLPKEEWTRRLPDYQAVHCGNHKILLAKNGYLKAWPEEMTVNCSWYSMEKEYQGSSISVAVVDIYARPDFDRLSAADKMLSNATKYAGKPFVLVGDFNTPPDSRAFDSWAKTLHPLLSEARGSWLPTWPVPLPVLQLDQAWATPEIALVSAHIGWSLASDHRPILLELSLNGLANAPPPD